MFCVKCHVAFDWRTGNIEKGVVHNPHYFQYLQEHGNEIPRNPNEVRCGGLPSQNMLRDPRLLKKIDDVEMKYLGVTYSNSASYVISIYRNVIHLREIVLRNLPTQIDNLSNQDFRIEYLMQKIDKEEFKKKLQRREKDREKKLEYRQILETYCDIVQDFLTRLSLTFELKTFIMEEKNVREYSENAIEKMNKKYNSNIGLNVF
jgi:hypothetical protein